MGVRSRVVRQTVTELFCDVCKNTIQDPAAPVGTLSVKSRTARGRPKEIQVAFHGSCLTQFIDGTGRKRGGSRKGSGGRKAGRKTGKNGRSEKKPARQARKKSSKKSS